jgi:glutamate dehydrogenase
VSHILNKVLDCVKSKLEADDQQFACILAKRFYANIDPAELEKRKVEDLAAVAIEQWNISKDRAPGEVVISLLDTADSGSSRHSVIQVSVDNSPFLVDSIHMCLNRLNCKVNMMLHFGGLSVIKDNDRITKLTTYNPSADGFTEAPISIELDRALTSERFSEIKAAISSVLQDVMQCVNDWSAMRQQMRDSIEVLTEQNEQRPSSNVGESIEFLRWLLDNHFTFLGCRDYTVLGDPGDPASMQQELISGTGLGVLHNEEKSKKIRPYNDLPDNARKIALSTDNTLIISKTNTKSTVHRDAYSDYIGVKFLDKDGNLKFERRFIGLFTSSAYSSNPNVIPFLREKVLAVITKSELPLNSHSGKDLSHILATLPRDDLFHSTVDELYNLAIGILHLQDRRQVRLFTHVDVYGRYVSCLVYMPKENFNTDVLKNIRDILMDGLGGVEVTFNTYFDENVLCRIHYVVRLKSAKDINCNTRLLSSKVVEVAELWDDALQLAVEDYFGNEGAIDLSNKYQNAFHAGYREVFLSRHAVFDIEKLESLNTEQDLEMSFYRPIDASENQLCLKLYHLNTTVPLSDALPILENLGLRVIGEQPYEVDAISGEKYWINDFSMEIRSDSYTGFEDVKDIFQAAFKQIWLGSAENDLLNSLVLYVGLNWREINVLRAYSAYFQQTGTAFSQRLIAQTLVNNSSIAAQIVKFFTKRFSPDLNSSLVSDSGFDIADSVLKSLDDVKSREEDRILRFFVAAIKATVRTNFFQQQEGAAFDYISFKFTPDLLENLPLPKPLHEIFVYSSAFEGIHLRGGDVARGGLRWSDRHDDFRKEVLGLMKAQIVKNTVIVPTGAKGGFVVKGATEGLSRDEYIQLGISCYKDFIRALLSLTDNYVDGKTVMPLATICYDDPDPYLVVAADKGTATFSDIANAIAVDEYSFWLGDAFASGGKVGYDHKKMAITARGAWVSALHHFDLSGLDITTEEFTVVGIGDMSGDVFGNGLLMSDNARLLAAFNHMHIFVDPNPDSKLSFVERQRLFALPRSGWSDYDASLISEGGGVFNRNAKLIPLSSQLKEMLGVEADSLVPSEFIRCLLKMDVDLLWNGGVGTFVKSTLETEHDVGDRANDALRINGNELGAKIVAEGGNLGLTQSGRIEYALAGGRLNTDFIDNSAGVDCSDHEVNIKILLGDVMNAGDIDYSQRNNLLESMADSVAQHVLEHNKRQNSQLSLAAYSANRYMNLYERYIDDLESTGLMRRDLVNLPDAKVFQVRIGEQLGLVRPELSVLMSYSKINLKQELAESKMIDDPYMLVYLFGSFPDILKQNYAKQMFEHRLKKEIIITEFVHTMVSDMGIVFVYQLQDELGCSVEDISIAYEAAKNIFNSSELMHEIDSLDHSLPYDNKIEMTITVVNLIRRATRWIVREHSGLSVTEIINRYSDGVKEIQALLPNLLQSATKQEVLDASAAMVELGAPLILADQIADCGSIYHSMNIIEASQSEQSDLKQAASVYFTLADSLELAWFREQIDASPSLNRWAILAKAEFKAQLDSLQRRLTCSALRYNSESTATNEHIAAWLEVNSGDLQRWHDVIAGMRSLDSDSGFAIMSVALKELADLAEMETVQ